MAGGLIQLVSYGIQDVYLTFEPQITFFKMVYRRYTNFALEAIPQFFDSRANFGESVTCTLSRCGDLVYHTYLYVILPTVPKFYNQNTNTFDDAVLFAWCKKIGYVIIKNITLEIGGQVIDRQYGEWLHIWDEMTRVSEENGLDIMIGNVPALYEFSLGKPTYELYIPLRFWFCRNNGLALPIIALQYNEVKVAVEFRKARECYIITPSHQYNIIEDICSFKQNDIITQTINGTTSSAVFATNDPIGQTIKYLKINSTSFVSATILKSSFRDSNGVINNTDYSNAISNSDSIQNTPYQITNGTTYCTPVPNIPETTVNYYNSTQFAFVQAFLLVDYVYLDNDERERFVKGNHEYLIEQVQIATDQTVSNSGVSLSLALNHPIKSLYWVCQLDYFAVQPINDWFNYTNSYKNGVSLIRSASILLNGQPRFSTRNGDYFNTVQPYQHHANSPAIGINCYSLSISPEHTQPSGTCNMSRIDNINLVLSLDTSIGPNNTATIRAYGLGYNVLRIINGLGGVVFIN